MLLSSCAHGEPSTLLLRGEDSGLILPLCPPLGRVSLPEEVAQGGGGGSDIYWTSSSSSSGVVTSRLPPQPALPFRLRLLAGRSPFLPDPTTQTSKPKLGCRVACCIPA